MKARSLFAASTILLLLALGTLAEAKPARGEAPRAPRPTMAPMPPMQPGFSMVDKMIDLGLDDTQIMKIERVRQSHIEKVLPLKRELRELFEEHGSLGEDVEANRDKIVRVSKKIGDLQADLEGMRIDLQADVKKLLTAEQLEKLGDRDLFGRSGRHGMHDGGRFHRGQRGMQKPPPAPDSPEPELDQR